MRKRWEEIKLQQAGKEECEKKQTAKNSLLVCLLITNRRNKTENKPIEEGKAGKLKAEERRRKNHQGGEYASSLLIT